MSPNGNGTKINGNLKIIILIVALIGNGIAVGAYYGRTDERLESIEKRLTNIETSVDDRYRGADAVEDFKLRDKRIDRLEDDMDDHLKDNK